MTCFHPITAWQRQSWTLENSHLQTLQKKFGQYGENLQSLLPKIEDKLENDRKRQAKIIFHYQKGYKKIQLPCNHCIGCILDKANNWAIRLMLEAENWDNAYFVTLTYNNEHIPDNRKVNKDDMTLFWKRLRYFFKGEKSINWKDKIEYPIRYFYCGEYGERLGRPHYHAIIFNIKLDDLEFYKFGKNGDPIYKSKKINNIWGKGFCAIGKLEYKSACYVARYTQKKLGIKPKIHYYKDVYDTKLNRMVHRRIDKKDSGEEFILMSRKIGIGRLYWEKFQEKILQNANIIITTKDKQGRPIAKVKPIPKYFLKCLEKQNWELYEQIKYKLLQQGIEYKKKIIALEDFKGDDEKKWEQHLKKCEEILLDKAKALKRSNFV